MLFVAVDKTVKPYLVKAIIDDVGRNDYTAISSIVAIYAAFQFGLIGAWSFFDWCENKCAPQMTRHITESLMAKISTYQYSFFQEQLSGRISSKISDCARRTPKLIIMGLVEFLQMAFVILVCIGLLATVHYVFALAILVWVLIFIGITYLALRRATVLGNQEAEADSKIWGRVVDYFANIFNVKLFSTREHERLRLANDLDDFVSKSRARGLFMRNYFSLQGFIFSCYILSCLYGMITLSQQGRISGGDFAMVIMLNFEVVNFLFHLATLLNSYIADWGNVGQALDTLEHVPLIQDKTDARVLDVKQASITFDNVEFNYKGADTLFQNKSITIASGTKVGLVGYSGGGKSTFASLILRLYDVTGGKVLIDDQDVRDVTQDSLRNAIGMIPQDPSLFNRSLMENIRYGRISASDAEVFQAAKLAHADEFISKLEHGYDALVGERGVKLSGGQRQRIAIARAILKNAPILILDEATSQLDSLTEELIQSALWEMMANKTSIVIAHRLSTLLHMDRILVFEKGKIVEDGTHQELLAKNGIYKNLWDTQVGGFIA